MTHTEDGHVSRAPPAQVDCDPDSCKDAVTPVPGGPVTCLSGSVGLRAEWPAGMGAHSQAHYLERLSRAWMKLSVPEPSFSGLSISDMVAKTTSLARNLCLKPKWMLKVWTRMSFMLQREEATRLSFCAWPECPRVGVSSHAGQASTNAPSPAPTDACS